MAKIKTEQVLVKVEAGLTAILVEKLKVVERSVKHAAAKKVKRENTPDVDQPRVSAPNEVTGAKNLKKLIRTKNNEKNKNKHN